MTARRKSTPEVKMRIPDAVRTRRQMPDHKAETDEAIPTRGTARLVQFPQHWTFTNPSVDSKLYASRADSKTGATRLGAMDARTNGAFHFTSLLIYDSLRLL